MNKVKCLICDREFETLSSHLRSHSMNKKEYLDKFPNAKIMSEDYVEHLRTTGKDYWKNNPDKLKERAAKISKSITGRKLSEESKTKISQSKKGTKAWNKGLTKETSESVRKYAESNKDRKRTREQKEFISNRTKEAMNNLEVKMSKAIIESNKNRIYGPEIRLKRSKNAIKLWENPEYAKKCKNPKFGNNPVYNGVRLDSDSEKLALEKLDSLGIEYIYQPGSFKYLSSKDNKLHNYYPDVYLVNEHLYLEIKCNKKHLYGNDINVKDKLDGMKKLGLKCLLIDRRDIKILERLITQVTE